MYRTPKWQTLLNLFLNEQVTKEFTDEIYYKQWVTTDHAEMISVIKCREELFESLVENLSSIKKQRNARVQSNFLKDENKTC